VIILLRIIEMSGVGESTMSRRKSFKKSLRESFRRLRRGRSDRRRKTTAHDDNSRQTYVILSFCINMEYNVCFCFDLYLYYLIPSDFWCYWLCSVVDLDLALDL